MRLSLSRRADYVLRAAADLASAWEGDGSYRKIAAIADATRIPRSYTPSILGSLARAGIAESKAGRTGGYRLTRSPTEVTVLEVIEAAEGPLTLDRCPMRGGPCRWDGVCAFHPTWDKATGRLRASLTDATLASVARTDAASTPGSSARASSR